MRRLKIKILIVSLALMFLFCGISLAAPTSTILRTILPEADSTYDLGSNAVRWSNGYFDNLDTATITISSKVDGNLVVDGNVTIGIGAVGVNYQLIFDGEDSDGSMTWMEDEDYLRFNDNTFMSGQGRANFQSANNYIYGYSISQLHLASTGEIHLVAGGANTVKVIHDTGVVFKLGDNAGAHKFIIQDSGNISKAELDSDGNLQLDGTITIGIGAAIDEFSTDTTLGGNSDTALSTEKAIKTYVGTATSGFISDLSSFDTDDLTEGSTNLYDKIVALTAGTNVIITGTYPNFTISSSGGVAATNWGSIAGTLSNQTDLQNALNLKYDAADFNTDFGTQFATKDTDDLSEGTNLYFTDARARSAISTTATGLTYTSATGVLSLTAGYGISTTVKQGQWDTAYGWGNHASAGYLTDLSGQTTTDLAEGTNLYFTNARAITALTGQNISIFTNDSGYLTSVAFADLSDYPANATGSLTNDGSGNFSWVDYSGIISFPGFTSLLADYGFTDNSANWNTAYGWGDWSGQGFITGVTWGDITGTQSIINLSGFTNDSGFITDISGFSTSDLAEGTNLYYTQARFDTAFTAKSTTDLSEGTNLYYTEARVSANTDVSANTTARHAAVTLAGKDYLTLVGQVITANSIDLTDDVTGVLPIANGGTNSSTALGNGKVMISSAGTIIESATITTAELALLNGIASVSTGAGDNDKFVTQGYVDDAISVENLWDRTGTILSPHTAGDDITTTGKIGVGFLTAPTFGVEIHGTDANSASLATAYYGNDTTAPFLGTIKYRGTAISPLAVASADNLGSIYFAGYDGSAVGVSATVRANATEAWTTSDRGASLFLATTPNTTNIAVDRLEIKQDGDISFYNNIAIGIGAAGVDYTLSFVGESNTIVATWMEDERLLRFDQGLEVYDTTLEFTDTYNGFNIDLRKTGGASDETADFQGITSSLTYDQAGGVIGATRALRGNTYHKDGDIGTGLNPEPLIGNTTYLELTGGKVYGWVRGYTSRIDQSVGHEITGDVNGMFLRVNCQGTVGGTVSLLRLQDDVGVDYAIYHDGTAPSKLGGILTTTSGRIHKTTRIINTASPYTILATDHEIFVDTDGGAVTVNLPAGIDGTNYRIINTGSSANNITIAPNGAELLTGANANKTLSDGLILILTYETTEGWW